ncbi:TonB-dependent receptor [Parashewanella curva]|uniref:TonB-dependent receptor n=1 Tax=Parashewanella curva TaxID=2338552 RepID=A0A3L8PVM6_9GAMM|nr:TonB-dependent receptor [Parashewanella curva]RLV58478.1 TonB-dependent receptor [Parashewanella curva]
MQANSKLAKAVHLALISSAAIATSIITISANAANDGSDNVERIQVTGSRIQRTDLETANPIKEFSAADIERTGVSTVSEFLRTNAAAGGFNESSTLSQAAGASSVGLRGLSSDYTLILLNGHRLPKNTAGGIFTDVNQIPIAAVQRIDVLPDGASAIYGSDAVAGVINIITKKDMEGVKTSVKYGAASDHFDGNELNASIVAGASNDDTNILFAAETLKRDPIEASDREMGKTAFIPGKEGGEGRSNFGIPGYINIDSMINPDAPDDAKDKRYDNAAKGIGRRPWANCPPQDTVVDKDGRGVCKFDFAPYYQLQPSSNRQSIYTQITHQATDNLSLTGEFRFTRAYTLTSNAPAPGLIDVSQSPFLEDFLKNARPDDWNEILPLIQNPDPLNKDWKQEAFIDVGRRYLDFPNRQKDNTNQTFEAVLTANYDINDNWGADWTIGHSRLSNEQVGAGGQLLREQLEKAFNSPNSKLNPFVQNNCNSKDLKSLCDSLQASIFRKGEYTIDFSTLTVSGHTGLELPGGEVGVAVGLDTRKEDYQDRSDPASVGRQVIGGAGSNGGGQYENKAAFIELSLPVIEKMDVNVAARYDKADWKINNANKATYSAKVSYRPIDDLLLRASYGTGFKAPNLGDLFTSVSQGVNRAKDSKYCKDNNISFDKCPFEEINSRSGGNPDLKPETSKTYNIGAVYQVTDALSASIDYWNLNVKDIIGSLSTQEILNEEANGNETAINLVKRAPNGRLSGVSNDYFVLSNLQNLSENNTTGLSYNFNWRSEIETGDISANLNIEQYLKRESQSSATQPLCDSIKDNAARKYRVNGNVSYGMDDLNVSLNMRFLPSFNSYNQRNTFEKTCELLGYYGVETEEKNDKTVVTDPGKPQRIASYLQFDVTSTYHFMPDNSVTFGIRNIFNRQPVFSEPDNWPFYDQDVYDNVGRFIYLQLDSKF